MALDMKSLIRKFNEDKVKTGGAGYIKLAVGETVVRLVTFTNDEGREELYVTSRTHFIENAAYACLKVNKGDYCPVCEYVAKLRKAGNDKVASQLSARNRFIFNAVHEGKLQLLECSSTVWKGIMRFFADEEYGNIADLKTGRSIKIVREGSGLDTEYSVLVSPKVTPVTLSEDPKDLYAMLNKPLDADALEAVLYQNYERLEDEAKLKDPEASDADESGGFGEGGFPDEAASEEGEEEQAPPPKKPSKPAPPTARKPQAPPPRAHAPAAKPKPRR